MARGKVKMTDERLEMERLENLRRANEVRMARAEIRRAISTRIMDPSEVLLNTPECCKKVAVGDFCRWVPYIGRKRAMLRLKSIGVSPTVPLGHLSRGTRERIVQVL